MKWNTLKFSNLVEAEKKRRRITNNSEMAKLMDVSTNTLQNIMKGATIPSVEYLCKMAIVLRVDLPVFFDYDESEPITPVPVESESELASCYKTMFKQQKEITEQQKEITDLTIEVERLKNVTAPVKDALTG